MVKLGMLGFEEDEDENGPLITVTKDSDLLGWVTFRPVPDNDYQWAMLKNKCYPLNGKADRPPVGAWVVWEFVGMETCSTNIDPPDTSEDGFTNDEIRSLMTVINLVYQGTSKRLSMVAESAATKH